MRFFIKFVVVSKCKRTLNREHAILVVNYQKTKHKKNQNKKAKAIIIASRNECNKCH